MRLLSGLIAAPLALLAASAKSIGIKQGKLSISSPDGLSDASYSLDPPQSLAPKIHLAEQTTFKLSFTIVDTSSGEGISPAQAHLAFTDNRGDEDVTLAVNVKSNGRASFTLNTAKLPPALSQTPGYSNLTLYLSDPSIPNPFSYPLTTLTFSPSLLSPVSALRRSRHSLPPRAGEPAFAPQEELWHTFKPDEKSVNFGVGVIGTMITLLPWFVLIGLVNTILPSLNRQSLSATSSLFLLTLILLEVLIAVYWIGLKLYHLIPAFLGLGGVSAYVGKLALAGLREKRLRAA